jgi:heme/copper-type cytochrome/quinol oxidase subunit 2
MTVVVVVVVIVIVIGTLALAMVSTTNADRSTALTAPSTSGGSPTTSSTVSATSVSSTLTTCPGESCASFTTTTASFTSTGFVTGTSVSSSDTYLTQCSVTGIGGFQLQVISDSTGAPVSGESINAVDRLGCDIVGQPPETQVVYLDNFSVGQGGWLTPVFPDQADPGGQLSFTVAYQGQAYAFSATVPPIGTSCVTLHVPSGNVTTTSVMNGEGSYCWQ